MSVRAGWRAECPPHVARLLRRLEREKPCTMSDVVEPTCFVVRCGCGRQSVTVRLGNRHQCSARCPQQPCLHVLFVLTTHFGLTLQNSVLWQEGICEAELAQLIDEQYDASTSACIYCKEEMSRGCKDGCAQCGVSFHAICCKLAARHLSPRQTPRCPRCGTALLALVHSRTLQASNDMCSACKTAAASHRCVLCAHYVLCKACYAQRAVHTHHPFGPLTSTHVITTRSGAGRDERRVQRDRLGELLYREIEPEDYDTLLTLQQQPARCVLNAAQFALLTRREYDQSSRQTRCPICLDEFTLCEPCIALHCHHLLHEQCARRWLTEYRAECPVDHSAVVGQ